MGLKALRRDLTTGTVTSVAFTAAPASVFDVSGSPITTSGTIALSMDNQSANTVLAGATSGGAAAPAFRALVAADIPASLPAVSIGGNAATATTAGTVTTAAQPAITSVGALTGLSVGGTGIVLGATPSTQAAAINLTNNTDIYARNVGNNANAQVIGFASNNTVRIDTSANGTTMGATLAVAGIVTMSVYGAGAATFSSAGVISSVSDETLKIPDGFIQDPIPMLMALKPYYFFGKPEANMGTERQLGFGAQNVRKAIGPEAAPDPVERIVLNDEGKEVRRFTPPWGYFDRSVLAVVVEACKRQQQQIEKLLAIVAGK